MTTTNRSSIKVLKDYEEANKPAAVSAGYGVLVQFSDLVVGDRFKSSLSLWTKIDYSSARRHGVESIELGNRGYGYIGDSVCSFEQNDQVYFVAP